MKKRAHVLYAVNCDTSRILLILNPETDNETAIKAIYDKIAEIEFCDLEEDDEYLTSPQRRKSVELLKEFGSIMILSILILVGK